jgi:hypothetical protein
MPNATQVLVLFHLFPVVVMPESAGILHRELPIARQIPKKVFSVLFGVGAYSSRTYLTSLNKNLDTPVLLVRS